jgi:large subunit ribosomal protein L10
MSKKVKNLLTLDLKKRLGDIEGVAVINPRGISATKNHGIRGRLRAKGLRMTVVKNTLARRATGGTKLAGFEQLLDGPSALIYGNNVSIPAIAKLLLEEKKTDEKIELRGAFFDGEIYLGDKGIEQASKLPTREEAIANLVAAILGPGKKLAAALKGPGGKLGGLLKTIEENAAKNAPAAAPEAPPAAPEATAAAPEAPAAAPEAPPAALEAPAAAPETTPT